MPQWPWFRSLWRWDRVKILESFAHRVPVVSTTLGAEGSDVDDGVHLLLADDPEAFAAATVRLIGDAQLRVRLTEAAEGALPRPLRR